MVDGEDKTLRPLRPAAPLDGPLAESGAAPDPALRQVPRPRRPWLRSETPDDAEASTGPTSGTDAPGEGRATGDADTGPGGGADGPKADADTTGLAAPGTTSTESKADGGASTDPEADGVDAGPKADATTDRKADGADADPKADGTSADPGTGDDSKAGGTLGADEKAAPRSRRHRVPFAHAVRLGPRKAAVTAARATRAWSRRPSGRLTLPGLFLLALVAATAVAGALVVPAAIRAPRQVAVDATDAPPGALAPSLSPSALPSGLPGGILPTTAPPTGAAPTGGPVSPVGGRPADALADWARQVGAKVGIAPVAMQAYGYAELVLAQTNRSCALSWTTLAAIGFVESDHGRANGATLGQDGRATPEIIGLPLDGQGGRMRIIDTDRGELDKDTAFDRAIGPMQFIPTTWQEIGADADNDKQKDPHDLDDAALAAGNYLCKGGRNLSIPADWWNAILSYNDVRPYAQKVFDTANRYGQASRT
ncbi:lytic murein transglycosylase [Micromonospora sp. URMC 103]|uniref:lytic transglycosylase domain-containing protein n=1 Tax=Micromonospora sp. URMC 103 TaxID=3423406 RepID=UPI003F1A7183